MTLYGCSANNVIRRNAICWVWAIARALRQQDDDWREKKIVLSAVSDRFSLSLVSFPYPNTSRKIFQRRNLVSPFSRWNRAFLNSSNSFQVYELLCRPVTSHDEQSALLVDGHFHFIADFAFRISRYPFFLPKGSNFPLRLFFCSKR